MRHAIRTALTWLSLLSVWKVGNKTLVALGTLWLLIEMGDYFLPPSFSEAVRPWWPAILLAGAVWGVIEGRPRLSMTRRVDGTDASVTVRVCDLFKVKADLIVGTNSTFDISMEDGVINARSVQGQFTVRETDIKRLDRDIRDGLAEYSAEETVPEGEKPYGNQARYPLGTVVAVQGKDRQGYFVAMAHLNRDRVAYSTTESVLRALPNVWEFVRAKGGLNDLVIGVLGSGFSRVKAQRDDLVAEIIRSFVAAARTGRFCEHLTIAIEPNDFAHRRVNLKRLSRVLEHECEVRAIPTDGILGTASAG